MARRTYWAVLPLAAGILGCQGAPGDDHASYVLLDREAREAGYSVEGAAKDGSVLPIEVEASAEVELVGPSRRMTFTPQQGELVHVRGAQASLEFRKVGEDVDPDRILVTGSAAAAKELGGSLAGEIVGLADGSWQISATNALGESSRTTAPLGIAELSPAEVEAGEGDVAELGPGSVAPVGPAVVPGHVRNTGGCSCGSYNLLGGRALTMNVEANLPPAVSCADPVVGAWMSQDYDTSTSEWYVFTLVVERVPGSPTALTGDITAEVWNGGSIDTLPPTCEEGRGMNHWTLRMTAEGTETEGKLAFGGTSWHTEKVFCGGAPHEGQYNLDQFSGPIANEGRLFAAVNNDGGRMVNEPTSFRRVACK
jgi:hypothetical protein